MDTWYLTKYVLSKGVIETVKEDASSDEHMQARVRVDRDGAYLYVRHVEGWLPTQYRIGTEAFTDLPSAQINARARQKKKIASLHKQIAKLEAQQFGAK